MSYWAWVAAIFLAYFFFKIVWAYKLRLMLMDFVVHCMVICVKARDLKLTAVVMISLMDMPSKFSMLFSFNIRDYYFKKTYGCNAAKT